MRSFLLCAGAEPWRSGGSSGWRLVTVEHVRLPRGAALPTIHANIVMEIREAGPLAIRFEVVGPDGAPLGDTAPRPLPAGPVPRIDHFGGPLPPFDVRGSGQYDVRLLINDRHAVTATIEIEKEE